MGKGSKNIKWRRGQINESLNRKERNGQVSKREEISKEKTVIM